MTICFFTEMQFAGKISRSFKNMRTEFAWMCALNADHCNINQIPKEKYDLGIVITPKNNPHLVSIEMIKRYCNKVAIMQEGPFWFFQDYDLPNQIGYYNNLVSSDVIFVHNENDKIYYQGITNHTDVRVLKSLMIDEDLKEYDGEKTGVMVGGNLVSWYGGFDSFMIASSVTDEVYSPKMGRSNKDEHLLGINQLPYLEWKDWIYELSKRKIGVHMMRTHAAGTFALNCSYLGIPCIGYENLDTQRILHPNLTVKDGDVKTAKRLIELLWNDESFYTENSILTKSLYLENYSEEIWKKTFYDGFK